jgi:hypothetical protein
MHSRLCHNMADSESWRLQVLAGLGCPVNHLWTKNGKLFRFAAHQLVDIYVIELGAQECSAQVSGYIQDNCSFINSRPHRRLGRAATPAYAMVLLTSSSISVAISSGVVCLFTFLLFLSGYVVQQQTVRSIQAALRRPPIPTPTLPVYFQKVHESAETGMVNMTRTVEPAEAGIHEEASQEAKLLGSGTIVKTDPEPGESPHDRNETPVEPSTSMERIAEASPAQQRTIQNLIADEINEPTEEQPIPAATPQPERTTEQPVRFAYVQLLRSPSQICSALLFFKLQMDSGNTDINRVILYPSSWEEDTSSEPFTSALALMRLVKDEYEITYRPIGIQNSFDDRDIERELLVHLATDDWEYDRIMYLRSPGLALNFGALDAALQASKTNSALSRNWTPDNPEPTIAPPILLISDHATYVPRGSNRGLTAEAFTSHPNHHKNEMEVEAAAQTAAYVHFEEGELEHRREEMKWYGGVFEKYERGRAEICQGINFDEGKTELKRVRKRGWK